MITINVQFSDGSDTSVVSYFACAQDPSTYQNLGVVDSDNTKWAEFYNSLSVMMQNGMPTPGV
jgi:hypothetical protein